MPIRSGALIIEQFVTVLNRGGLEPLFGDDVPEELRTQELTEISGTFNWEIRPADANPWVQPLEETLPSKFPPLYRYLISRFRFAAFEAGPVMFFANTGAGVPNELSRCMFVDKHLYPVLLGNGFVQFGRQAGGSYDPVCFAQVKRNKQGIVDPGIWTRQ